MTAIDWVILGFVAVLALRGYSRGLFVGVLSLVGFVFGALAGTRLAPLVAPGVAHSPYAVGFGLLAAILVGTLLARGVEGVAERARLALRLPGLRTLDGVLGAMFTGCVALAIVWLLGAIALHSSGSRAVRADLQRSAILQELNALLPPSGPILNELARIDPLTAVPGPFADVAAPPPDAVAGRGVAGAGAGVVRVIGSACGLGIEGSGWVAAPGIVVTNAHVVAGEADTAVQVGGVGPTLPAVPLVFDVHNDIAVLRVPGLDARPLRLARSARPGTPAAILGYPQDGAFDREPARLGTTALTSTEDAYGNGPVLRTITELRGLVRPGNSGGPLVDRGGRVLGTVFAAVTNPPPHAPGGFAVPDSVVAHDLALARSRSASVGSGACAN